jgi:RNA polymerase sigma factor (sigma-70 family)
VTDVCKPITKERLRDYRRLLVEIESQENRLARLTAQASSITATLSFVPHGAANNDRLTDYVIRKDELAAAYLDNLTRATAEAVEIERAIGALTNPRERLTITLYYIDGLNWREVSERMHYSVDHVYTLHGRALKNLLLMTKDNSSSQ